MMRITPAILVCLAACATKPPATPAILAIPPVQPSAHLAGPMAKLSFMRGVWRGIATGTTPDGKPYTVTQTERMGPMLGGDVVVVEGRGYRDDGTTGFNAFAVASWNQYDKKYELRSYAQGNSGTFELKLTDTGYIWEIPAGPNAKIRFTATVGKDTWREVGEYVAEGKPPVKSFEMNLKKIGDTDWPLGTPVAPK